MAQDRGSAGLVPEPISLAGLTEIRVHGVGGTSPESLLGDLAPTRVSGDRVAGFYRTRDARGRHREAYSWGGLTSLSRTRALWAFLMPSMLANMAGWMARRWVTSGAQEEQAEPTTWLFRWLARLAALALTLSTAAMVCLLTLDLVGYQCGGQDVCRRAGWWSRPTDALFTVDRPGYRIALGAAAATLVALGFAFLARHTRSAYERVEPPTPIASTGEVAPGVGATGDGTPGVGAQLIPSSDRCAAAQPGGLRNPQFWSGLRWHAFLSRLHLTAALSVVAVVLAWTTTALAPGTAAASTGRVALLGGVAGIVVVLGLLALDEARPRLADAALTLAALALALAAVAGVRLPAGAGPAGSLPGSRTATAWVWTVSLALLVPLGLQQVGAWVFRVVQGRGLRRAGKTIPRLPLFPWAAPFVMNAVAMLVANTVLLSVIIYVGHALGTLELRGGPAPGAAAAAPGTLYLPALAGSLAAALSLGLVTILLAYAVGVVVALLRARATDPPRVEADLRAQYRAAGVPDAPASPQPRTEAGWWRSAFDPPMFGAGGRAGTTPTRWVRSVAAMRFLARASRSIAIPLIAMTVAGIAGAVLVVTRIWVPRVQLPTALIDLGITLAVALPPLYVLVLLSAWRNERYRRVLSTLFDVGSFFPRAFHPFAPPAYAERAVPELTRRIWRLHDNNGRVVLTAHSQGSVIAAAVVGRRSPGRREGEPRIGVVTFGAPLAKLYRWAFPALFSDGFLKGIADGTPGMGRVVWHNVYYATDYIGGPVRTGDSVIPDGVDHELVDPPTHLYVADQPLPRVLSHTGYWSDEAFWAVVDETCDDIAGEAAGPGAGGAGAEPPAGPGGPPEPAAPAGPMVEIAPDPSTPVAYR